MVQADDHLYDKQGLLLVEQEGFVVTSYTNIRAIYYDGISEQAQEGKICDEENFDLTPIRNKFYQLAASELTKNGFEYQVDKDEFADFKNNKTVKPDLAALVKSHSRNERVISLKSNIIGDQAENMNPFEVFPVNSCKCTITKCNCDRIKPQTQTVIKFPFKIKGDIYIRLDFGYKFPKAQNKHMEQFNDVAIGMINTEKGQYDSYLKSEGTYKLVELMIDENYVHTIIESKNITELIYAYALDDHFCTKNNCDQNTMMDIEITWELKKDRRRRSFFGLETNSETNEKIRNAMKITSGLYDKSQNSIVNLDRMIKQTDQTVEQQTQTLNDLYKQLCQLGSQARIQADMFKIERSIINNVKLMIEMLQDCSLGKIPRAFSYSTIQQLCEANINKNLCYKLQHKVTNIMKCEINKIHLLSTKYLLNLKVHIPNAFKAQYKLFKPVTIPVFDNQYHHEIKNIQGTTILKYETKPEIVILTNCDDSQGILICQADQSSDQKSHACLTDIINNHPTTCWTQSYKNEDTCFVKKFSNGLLVSTKFPLQVHQHSLGNTFHSKSRIINGTTVVKNEADSSYSVACNGILVSTEITDPEVIQIHNHHNFVWDDTVQPISNKKLTEDIEQTQKYTRNNLADLNVKFEKAHGDIDYREIFDPTGTHAPTWLIVGSILLVMFAIFLLTSLLVCICKCYHKCKEPVVELAGYMQPKSASRRYNRNIPMMPNERLI